MEQINSAQRKILIILIAMVFTLSCGIVASWLAEDENDYLAFPQSEIQIITNVEAHK